MEPTTPAQPPPASANPPGSAGIPAGDSELNVLAQPEAHKNQPLTISPIIGKIDKLTEAEQIRYMGCEAVLSMGWHTFVDVGLALAQIRDERLYREEFDTFEASCRSKWQYGRKYSVNPRFCGVRWQSESASGDTALAESDGRELRGCTFAKSQSGVATSFCRRTPYNAASPNVYWFSFGAVPRLYPFKPRSARFRLPGVVSEEVSSFFDLECPTVHRAPPSRADAFFP